jgi:NADPH2:quinone reductase
MCSGSGGYAGYAVADAGRTMAMPSGMSFADAAVLPLALLTMHDALITNGRLASGESVLIQGASSGVGLMGLQIAQLKGAKPVIGAATNATRRERLAAFGATLALDSRDPSWPDAALAATSGRGVDLIVDMISASVANQNLKAAAVRGRIVNVGRLGGVTGAFDFDLHALKRIDYIGVTFRTRGIEEVREITRHMQDDLWDAVTAGTLRLPIDRSFKLAEASAAHDHMRANAHFGKIVLIP